MTPFYKREKVQVECVNCNYIYLDKPEKDYSTICPVCGEEMNWEDIRQEFYLDDDLSYLKVS